MEHTVSNPGIRGLKLLFTVVDRNKAEFYLDVLSQFEVNFQMAVAGKGTAGSEIAELFGLNEHKAVLLSVLREDRVEEAMNCLEEKFETIRGGKGISFAVPMSSIIGVNLYRFFSDRRDV